MISKRLLSMTRTLWVVLLLLPLVTVGATAAGASPGAASPGLVTTPTGQIDTNITPTPIATEEPPTATPTATGTATPTDLPPTATPSPTVTTIPGFFRPVVVITSYQAQPGTITPGLFFKLNFSLANQGQVAANNLIVTFTAGELIPRGTGGVITVARLQPGEGIGLTQQFAASATLAGEGPINLEAHLNYTDDNGAPYTESFAIGLNSGLPEPTAKPPSGPGGPTATPTASARSQLVIQDTKTDVAILQPGTHFMLEVMVANVGDADARRVTMIAGGGSVTPNDPSNPEDPPGSGGVTASGGEFTNFSPLGASNIQSLGDIPAGVSIVARQPLIVNVTTNPGAYSFKISFAYYDAKGNLQIDDQVITLLVYLRPSVEVSFYRDPGPLFTGQPNPLPLQIINLGRKSVVLGNMRVVAPAGELMNNTVLIGNLEAGGYFTLDALLTPFEAGPMDLEVIVDYTDDFNQPQTISRTISVEVIELPPMEEPPVDGGPLPGEPIDGGPETTWQIVMRIVRGMIGLDSGRMAPSGPEGMPPGEMPPGEFPSEQPPPISFPAVQ